MKNSSVFRTWAGRARATRGPAVSRQAGHAHRTRMVARTSRHLATSTVALHRAPIQRAAVRPVAPVAALYLQCVKAQANAVTNDADSRASPALLLELPRRWVYCGL